MLLISQILAFLGGAVAAIGIGWRFIETRRRVLPADSAPEKGKPLHGIVYAFTLGMMPWAKESTRIHFVLYMRGIVFHVGIFAALAALAVSPFWAMIPRWILVPWALLIAMGSLLGVAGAFLRIVERNLRGLSLPDDHFAVLWVSLFMALAVAAMASEAWLIPFYLVSAVMLLYLPFGKIRHCLYFFFSRFFFGRFFGRRGVLPHPAHPADSAGGVR